MTKTKTKAKPRKKVAPKPATPTYVPTIEHKGFGFATTRSGHVAVFRSNRGLLEGVVFFEDMAPEFTQWHLDGSEFAGQERAYDLVAPYDPPKEYTAWMLLGVEEDGSIFKPVFTTRRDAEFAAKGLLLTHYSIIRLTGRDGAE